MHARLGAAGEDHVGVAALDQLGALPDCVRARRTCGDDRVVGAADPERDRHLSARRIDEDVRQEERRDAVGAALAHHVRLLDDPHHAADRRAEHDPDARGIEAVERCVGDSLARRGDRKQHVALEPPRLFRRYHARAVEVLDLRGDAHGKVGRVERPDPVDPAPPRQRRVPRRARVVAERRHRAETRDDDPAHRGSLMTSQARARFYEERTG